MHRARLSGPARADIDSIWHYTLNQYDLDQADRYVSLIEQALEDIGLEPKAATTRARPELGGFIRSYPISLSKRRGQSSIQSPRHVIIYTLAHEDEVFILRILHETMDIKRQIET
ncbi:MAG: type II toxin-antitoxin system RelE/ParE family toxin [Candidatus Hydrogenedentota bacterium]